MKDPETSDKSLFRPGKARSLQEDKEELDSSQRALLLALTQVESEMGRELSPEEKAAVEAICGKMDDADCEDIVRAVRKMVETPADPDRVTSWPELRDRLDR
jgi:hypothetical protein